MIEIKRLSQRGSDFVPITLAEAVVVNVDRLPIENDVLKKLAPFVVASDDNPSHLITTLDKVLDVLGIEFKTFNDALGNKQDKLIAGAGITISNGVISTNFNFTLYKLVTASQFAALIPSAELMNTIYIVPKHVEDGEAYAGNICTEHICVELTNNEGQKAYCWEQLGEMVTEFDTSNLLTIQQYAAIGVFTANVTTSTGDPVAVAYTIPANLYDNVANIYEGDQIIATDN